MADSVALFFNQAPASGRALSGVGALARLDDDSAQAGGKGRRMQDVFPIKRVDHLELYVGNAKQAAAYYHRTLGFAMRGYRGLETGTRDAVSYLLDQGQVRLIVTGALTPDHAVARFVFEHGDGVGVVALEVPNAVRAFEAATAGGATAALEPTEEHDRGGTFRSDRKSVVLGKECRSRWSPYH